MLRNQSAQVVIQEVHPYVEAVVGDEALREVRREAEDALVIGHEGGWVLGEEEEEQASVLEEGAEAAIQTSRGLALVGADHNLSGLALRQKAFLHGKIPTMKVLNYSTVIKCVEQSPRGT